MVVVAVALLLSLLSEEGGRKREKKPRLARDDRITYVFFNPLPVVVLVDVPSWCVGGVAVV